MILDILQEVQDLGWEDIKFYNLSLIDFRDFGKLFFRLLFNSGVLFVLINLIYGKSGRREFTFTYYALGTAIFLMCFLLEDVKLELGFALGLFAVFGILKYRTDPIPIREMTYLFVVIGVAVLNALANKKVSVAELVLTNAAILFCVYLLEKLLIKSEGHIDIIYERIENIKVENKDALLEDLQKRTGLKIKRFEYVKVDFLKDIAYLRVYYDKTALPKEA
ncbi:MAG: DUF4956 domain-containing protein [Bacteroidales bacterium]|nr:DUF4956 domain-containing protein [Bacteroidales bacterium]MBQ5539272.1 DUF4956 domain-containing protein [Bacteroidales bacterium]